MSEMDKYKYLEDKNTSSDLSEDDELIEPWENILLYFSVLHLQKLCDVFHEPTPGSTNLKPIQLSKDQFVDAVDNIIGNSQYSFQAVSLFNEIPYPESEKITWLQLINFYIDYTSVEEHRNISLATSKIFNAPHIKIESIMKIVLIEMPTSFGYAIVSKYGKIGLYDGDLNLLTTYNVIFARTDVMKIGKPRHKKISWVTDAVFIPNICLFVISTSARSLMFYDASSLKHKPLWLIEGLPNIIHCLAFNNESDLTLLMGNSDGCLVSMRFLQQKDGLFRKKYTDKLNAYYWRELFEESQFVSIKKYKKMHSDIIHSIIYYPQTSSVVTCSKDPKNSVIFYNLKDNKKGYIFKICRASCFAICHNLRILMTGSDSGLVYIWNSVVTSRPMAVLKEHKLAVVDVQILEQKRVGLSLSKNGIVKIWDLSELKCQQTLTLDFPAFGVLGKLIEWGKSSIFPGPKRFQVTKPKLDTTESELKNETESSKEDMDPWNRSEILICCCNHIAIINIEYETGLDLSKSAVLPPPALQNDVIIPDSWRNMDDPEVELEPRSMDHIEITEYVKTTLEKLEELDICKAMGVSKFDINYRIAALESVKAKMRNPVSQCAPYLALDLYEIEEPKLSAFLPVPNYRSTQKIVDKTQRLLSAASFRSGILSDRSSRSRSSRSSIVEF